MRVLVIGETGIVHGLWTEKSTLNGKDMSGTYRYTDIFAKTRRTLAVRYGSREQGAVALHRVWEVLGGGLSVEGGFQPPCSA